MEVEIGRRKESEVEKTVVRGFRRLDLEEEVNFAKAIASSK